MALIKCPECGNEVSDKAETCIHCGCPIKVNRSTRGKIIVQAENVFLGIGGCFLLYDKEKNLIAKIKRGETYEMEINVDTTLYIKTRSFLSTFKPLESYAGQINRFSVSILAGIESAFCTVKRIQ